MRTIRASLLTQKRTFVLITSVCWAVAAIYYFLADPPYVSEAKLMVRYMISASDVDGPMREGKSLRDSVIRSEMDILASRELAEKVAEEMGPDLLAGSSDLKDAASIMAAGLNVSNEKESNVIRITFRHADAETAEAALTALIKAYLHKNLEMQRRLRKQSREADLLINESVPNVSVVQPPTPAAKDVTRRNQILIVLVAGGPVLGLLVAAILALRGRPFARREEDGGAASVVRAGAGEAEEVDLAQTEREASLKSAFRFSLRPATNSAAPMRGAIAPGN